MANQQGRPRNPDLGKRHCIISSNARSRVIARLATVLVCRPILNGGFGMRRTTEFKGYRSIVVYDTESGTFVSESIPEDRMEITLNEALQAWAEILPFPEAAPEKIKHKQRKAG
jgi:hypothetical protein